jgi:hypothetical protein
MTNKLAAGPLGSDQRRIIVGRRNYTEVSVIVLGILLATYVYGSCDNFQADFKTKVHIEKISKVKNAAGKVVPGCWVLGTSEVSDWKKISAFADDVKVCSSKPPVDVQFEVIEECCDSGAPPCSYQYEDKSSATDWVSVTSAIRLKVVK